MRERQRRELGYRRISALHGQATKPAREISENNGAPFQLTWYLHNRSTALVGEVTIGQFITSRCALTKGYFVQPFQY